MSYPPKKFWAEINRLLQYFAIRHWELVKTCLLILHSVDGCQVLKFAYTGILPGKYSLLVAEQRVKCCYYLCSAVTQQLLSWFVSVVG